MSRTLFLIFNHTITPLQEQDARLSLKVGRVLDLPNGLKPLWNQIPPDLDGVSGYLEPVKSWLAGNARKGDYVLIQGDFGACYVMVNFSLECALIPVYSTTTREAVEEHADDGTVKMTHRFKHVRFRRYRA